MPKLSTLPALTIPASAAAEIDPIFAAIERHKVAFRASQEADNIQAGTTDAEWSPDYDPVEYKAVTEAARAAHAADADPANALTTIQPTTMAGLLALIRHVEAFNAGAFFLDPDSPPIHGGRLAIEADVLAACSRRRQDRHVRLFHPRQRAPRARSNGGAIMIDHIHSRRAIIAGMAGMAAAGASAAAIVPVAAAQNPDAELVALGARHAILEKEEESAAEHQNACEDAAVELYPPDPDALLRRPGDRLMLECPGRSFEDSSEYLEQEIEQLRAKPRKRRYIVDFDPVTGQTWPVGTAPKHIRDALQKYEPWPEAQARAEEIISTYDIYMRSVREADEKSGFTKAQEIFDALWDELEAVRLAIATMPAKTVEGLRVKAALVAEWTDGGMNSAPKWTKVMMSAMVRDVQAMG